MELGTKLEDVPADLRASMSSNIIPQCHICIYAQLSLLTVVDLSQMHTVPDGQEYFLPMPDLLLSTETCKGRLEAAWPLFAAGGWRRMAEFVRTVWRRRRLRESELQHWTPVRWGLVPGRP